jgi:PmbA protein
MFQKLTRVLERAQARGVAQAEVFASRTLFTRVSTRDQKIEELKQAEDVGFALRVIKDQALGFAFSSEINTQSIETVVDQALAAAEFTTPDEFNNIHNLPDQDPVSPQALQIYDEHITKLSLSDKIQTARQIEQAARQNKQVTKTELVSYSDHCYEVFLANTAGYRKTYQGTYCGGTAEVIAEADDTTPESGLGIDFKTNFQDLDPVAIGQEAAQNACQMLRATPLKTQSLTVVFSPLVAIDFLEVISPMVCADNILKGKSLLIGKEATTIATPLVTIIDNGRLPKAAGSAPFDAEGTSTSETVIVKDGVLQAFLSDNYTAAKIGKAKTTGNAQRASFMALPTVGTTNIYFQPGVQSEPALLQDITNGFYVTKVMGLHTVNPISGDFSLGASGLLIKNGELTTPVRGVAIAGNLLQLLGNIIALGNNLRFVLGTGAPTIRLGELTVSGS